MVIIHNHIKFIELFLILVDLFMKKKIILFSNSFWNLYNFREDLIKNLNCEYELCVVAPEGEYQNKFKELSIKVVNLNFSRISVNPFHDIILFIKFLKICVFFKPDLILNFTIKPVIYGSLVGSLINTPCLNTITGLGRVFYPIWKDDLVRKIVIILYRISLRKTFKIFFQNKDDLNYFVNKRMISKKQSELVWGSGVNLNKFNITKDHKNKSKITFLMISRLVYQKGIIEYIQSSKQISQKYHNINFILVGGLEKGPNAIPINEINKIDLKNFFYYDFTDDIKKYYSIADCFVLPSYYREGIPKVLLEASACGLPLIVADNIGSKEVVYDGVNGYICKLNDYQDLTKKLEKFINLTDKEIESLGKKSKELAYKFYDVNILIRKYITEIKKII
tara:strand:- start:4768 stop:5946 length:1179 start_codon:yes stop_codon:yes gene_type:complete